MSPIALLPVLLAVSAGAAEVPPAPNLVSNGSFETDADKDGVPDGWTTSGHAVITQTLTSDAGREGGHSAKLVCTHFEGDSAYHHVMLCQLGVVAVEKGKWHRLSFWARSAGRAARSVSVGLSNTKTWGQTGLYEAFGPGERWQRFEFLFNAQAAVPAEASRLQFWFAGEGTLWLDDVEMREVDVTPAWHPQIPTEGVRNFVPNSSFECGAAGWGSFTPRSAGWGANLYHLVGDLDDATAVHGRHSLRIHLRTDRLEMLYFDYYDPVAMPVRAVLAANRGWFKVARGRPYVLSASLKAARPGTAAILGVVQAEGGFLSLGTRVGTDWQRATFVFRPQRDYVHVAVGLDLEASKMDDATLWLDALQLEPGEKASGYAPRAPVEAFVEPAAPDGVFTAPSTRVEARLAAFNDTAAPVDLARTLVVSDFFDREVAKRAVTMRLAPGGGSESLRDLASGRRGFFRVTLQQDGSPAQSIRTAVLDPVDTGDSRLGMNHAYPSRFLLESGRRAGILWHRDWSVKWQTVEPKPGPFDLSVPDVQIDRVREAGGKVLLLFPFPSAQWSSTADPARVAAEAGGNEYLRSRLPAAFAAKSMDDFKRYIRESVRHYRGRVTHYQVLNEPLYTTYALPAKFGYTMADYVAHVKAVHEVAKVEDPRCVIVGGIGCSPADRRAREFIETGGLKWVDVVDIHIYAAASQFDWLDGALSDLKALMAKRGEERPMWITEFGLYADDDPARVPRQIGDTTMQRCGRPSELEASCDLVRLVAMFAAHGVEKVFFHAGTAQAINQPDEGGVFFEYGGAPRKMYAAAAVLARMLPPEARFVKADVLGAGLKSYTFKTPAGHCTVAWSADEDAHALRPRTRMAAFDLMGNRLEGEALSVTGVPVYFTHAEAL